MMGTSHNGHFIVRDYGGQKCLFAWNLGDIQPLICLPDVPSVGVHRVTPSNDGCTLAWFQEETLKSGFIDREWVSTTCGCKTPLTGPVFGKILDIEKSCKNTVGSFALSAAGKYIYYTKKVAPRSLHLVARDLQSDVIFSTLTVYAPSDLPSVNLHPHPLIDEIVAVCAPSEASIIGIYKLTSGGDMINFAQVVANNMAWSPEPSLAAVFWDLPQDSSQVGAKYAAWTGMNITRVVTAPWYVPSRNSWSTALFPIGNGLVIHQDRYYSQSKEVSKWDTNDNYFVSLTKKQTIQFRLVHHVSTQPIGIPPWAGTFQVNNRRATLTDLGVEVLSIVASMLDRVTLCRLAQASHLLHDVISADSIWKPVCLSTETGWGPLMNILKSIGSNSVLTWKQFYASRMSHLRQNACFIAEGDSLQTTSFSLRN